MIFALLTQGAACAQSESTIGDPENIVIIDSDTGKHRFHVEIADDFDEITMGLMYRTELPDDAGMLFVFKPAQSISMWMKNTLIPLDMAFIGEDGVIKRIAENTTPRSLEAIPSGEPVLAVLEVNGGAFARLGVKPGDRVRHPVFKKH